MFMDNNKLNESRTIKVQIQGDRSDESKSSINLIFKFDKDVLVELTDSKVEDIKTLFDNIFDTIIQDKKYLIFKLDDNEKTDLYHDVAEQIIDQINSEIDQSKNNINRIWRLTDKESRSES